MLRDAKLQVHEENFHTFSFMYFLFIFLRARHDYFFSRDFESVRDTFFQEI